MAKEKIELEKEIASQEKIVSERGAICDELRIKFQHAKTELHNAENFLETLKRKREQNK